MEMQFQMMDALQHAKMKLDLSAQEQYQMFVQQYVVMEKLSELKYVMMQMQ